MNHFQSFRLHAKDDVRALFVLLQCPLFSSPSTYSVYSHLLRQILGLSNNDHHLFVHWLKTYVQDMHLPINSQIFMKKEDCPSLCQLTKNTGQEREK